MKISSVFINWKKTDATSMVTVIKDIILRLGLDREKLLGQCSDGYSTMMVKKKRVETRIKKNVLPLAFSTHWYVHCLNLTCGNWIKNSTVVSKSINTSHEITKLVKFSPKHDSHLRKIHKEECCQNKDHCTSQFSTLRLFSETRWTVRASSLPSIYENYKELEELWDWCLNEYKDREARARIHGEQSQIQTFE